MSALAICTYLASIKINPSKGKLSLLVLDDILIGLDMSNRLPLLKILKEHFDYSYQIVLTTYDRMWFELVRNYFSELNWKFIEIYSKKLLPNDFEIPVIKESIGFLDKAKQYLDEKDYKASAVYIRTEFERLVKKICEDKSLIVTFKSNKKELNSEDFWHAIKTQTDIDKQLVKDIEVHRSTVMNPFNHFDLENPEFKKELGNTIKAIEKLKAEKLKKTTTIEKLKSEIAALEEKLKKKDSTIEKMGKKLSSKSK